jgi:hypothetical protein
MKRLASGRYALWLSDAASGVTVAISENAEKLLDNLPILP